uniref:Uncharacterized protein n=1 Tax=Junco hyemalis TaxID=40217 RepID=A0A8C5IGU8_JUNHY
MGCVGLGWGQTRLGVVPWGSRGVWKSWNSTPGFCGLKKCLEELELHPRVGLGAFWGGLSPQSIQVLMSPPSPPGSWDRKNNPEPWNKLSPTDQYKVSTGWTGRAGSVGGRNF